MGAIRAAAVADGYETMIDGTNASDECGDRPGMKVLEEQHILSPLRICGLTKSDVAAFPKRQGFSPGINRLAAYACLATRILAGEKITAEKLKAIEESEAVLFAMGFSDFSGFATAALLQFTEEQQRRAQEMLGEIRQNC